MFRRAIQVSRKAREKLSKVRFMMYSKNVRVDDAVRHRAQVVLLLGVNFAYGGLRSGGTLEQRCLIVESRLMTPICAAPRSVGANLRLYKARALVGHGGRCLP